MKFSLLTVLGIMLSLNSFSQQLFTTTLTDNPPYSATTQANSLHYELWSDDENYASSSSSSATDVVLWSEDFANGLDGNNSSTPQTWTVSGSNDDLWEHDSNGSAGPFAGSTPLTLDSETKDNGWMIFDADKGNIGLPQSAFQKKHGELITPSIDLSNDTNVTLKFTHMYRYCCSSDHKLKIYVFDGTSWSNGIDVSIGGDVNVVKATNDIELNITQYAALKSDVKIKFSWEANTAIAYYWMIDDVKIIETKPYDANLLGAYHVCPTVAYGGSSFKIMNLEQAEQTSYFFVGSLQNSGYNNIDSTRIYANVTNASQSFQSHGLVSTPTSIDTFYTNKGFTPTAVGIHTVDVFGGNDDNQFNTDTIKIGFEIDQYEYGNDNGNYNQGNFGRQPINDDGSYEIGNRFMIYKSAELGAVKIRMDSRTGSDAKGKVKLYEVQSDGSFTFYYESQEENIGQNTGSWYDFKLDNPWDLSADVGYVVTLFTSSASSATDTAFISTGGIVNPQESFLLDIDGVDPNAQPNTWFYTTSAPCIRLDFDPKHVGIKENSYLEQFSVHPNPSQGVFKLNVQTKSTEDLQLNITNILGQSIYVESLSDVTTLNKEINLSHLEKGMYLVNLISQTGNTTTHKVIIK